MPESEDFYTPAHIDEQIDALLQARQMPTDDLRMAGDLRAILENKRENTRSLQSVLDRLLADLSEQPTAEIASLAEKHQYESPRPLQTLPRAQARHQRKRVWSALAAILIIAALLGSMLFILNSVHPPKGGSLPAGNPTTPSVSEGQILYTSDNIRAETSPAWSPDGKRVALVTTSDIVESFDALTGKNVLTYPLAGAKSALKIAWSPDGTRIAVTYLSDGPYAVSIFNAQTAQLLHALPSSPSLVGDVLDVAWSPEGKYLSVSNHVPSGHSSEIDIWNTQSWSLVKRLANYSTSGIVLWQPHGALFATIGCFTNANCQATVLDTATWSVVKTFPGIIKALDWSPDGKQLALVSATNTTVRLVDIQTSRTVKQFIDTQAARLYNVHWSPDGTRLILETAASSANNPLVISIWSTHSGTLLYTFPYSDVIEATWSPDSKYIACHIMGENKPEKILIWAA